MRKLVCLIESNGEEIFYRNDLFPTVAYITECIKDEEEDIIPERQKASAVETEGKYCLLNDYLLKESLETALTTCHNEFTAILARLQQVIENQLASIINDPLYQAISEVLDTRSY